MDFDDFSDEYLTPELGILAAATATLLSPRVRGALRRGAVAGLAGLLAAGDRIAGLARGVAGNGESAIGSPFVRDLVEEARRERSRRTQAVAGPAGQSQAPADAAATQTHIQQ